MSRQAILDEPASACPALAQFLGGYFHQDWVVGHDGWEGVVDEFAAESTRHDVEECSRELGEVLAAGLTDADLGRVLERLGCSLDPAAFRMTHGQWLRAVLARLPSSA